MIANELYKNQNKQESPKADLALDKEIEELEKIPFKDRTPKDHMRLEDLRNKKMREEREENEEALLKKIEETEKNINLSPTEREKLLGELREKLEKIRKQKELWTEMSYDYKSIEISDTEVVAEVLVGGEFVGYFSYNIAGKSLTFSLEVPSKPTDLRGLGIMSEAYKRLFADFDVKAIKSSYIDDNAAKFKQKKANGKKISDEEAIYLTPSGGFMKKHKFKLDTSKIKINQDTSKIEVFWTRD